jgi:hypothetical protein
LNRIVADVAFIVAIVFFGVLVVAYARVAPRL